MYAQKTARSQLEYLDDNADDWRKIQPYGDFPEELEEHIDPIPLHRPLPDAEVHLFDIHEDTLRALRDTQTALSEYFIDYGVDKLDEIPDEFDSKAAFREHLHEHRVEMRAEVDGRRLAGEEVFVGDDFVTVDDVVRMALQMVPDDEYLEDIEDEALLLMPGVRPEDRYELLKLFSESIDDSLLRERPERR